MWIWNNMFQCYNYLCGSFWMCLFNSRISFVRIHGWKVRSEIIFVKFPSTTVATCKASLVWSGGFGKAMRFFSTKKNPQSGQSTQRENCACETSARDGEACRQIICTLVVDKQNLSIAKFKKRRVPRPWLESLCRAELQPQRTIAQDLNKKNIQRKWSIEAIKKMFANEPNKSIITHQITYIP